MLKSLDIENFRSFKLFKLQPLGRINLLVGKNNSGKTSILEIIHLLCFPQNLRPLEEMLRRRGEYILEGNMQAVYGFDLCSLFNGHQPAAGSQFSAKATSIDVETDGLPSTQQLTVTLSSKNISKYMQLLKSMGDLIQDTSDEETLEENAKESPSVAELIRLLKNGEMKTLDLILRWSKNENQQVWSSVQPLSEGNYWLADNAKKSLLGTVSQHAPILFVASNSLTIKKMQDLFEQVVLKPEENLIYEALQIIDPNIQRLAPIAAIEEKTVTNNQNGFVIQFKNNDKRLPIGILGEGIGRILGLILALVNVRDGILLIDDIDTGLHYTTMYKLWKLVWETANKLNVQIFATTHNSDCWQSLADITRQYDIQDDDITIHRIEKEVNKSIEFTASEILIAADQALEVR